MTTIESVSAELLAAVRAHLPGWVVREVERLHLAWSGTLPAHVASAADRAAVEATGVIGSRLERLLALDIDEQTTNPLSILRSAVPYPTRVLRDAGVPEVVRDDFAVDAFPDDVYDLTPASFSDIAAELHEPGMRWGAAKAHVHLRRRSGMHR